MSCAQVPLSFKSPFRTPCEIGSSGTNAPMLAITSTTWVPDASSTTSPVLLPSNRINFIVPLRDQTVPCAEARWDRVALNLGFLLSNQTRSPYFEDLKAGIGALSRPA